MAIDWDALLFSPIHAEFGVECVFTTVSAADAISAPVDSPSFGVTAQTTA